LCAGLLASNSMCRFFLEGRVYYLASYKWSALDGFLIQRCLPSQVVCVRPPSASGVLRPRFARGVSVELAR
jgi:hypothetical protein